MQKIKIFNKTYQPICLLDGNRIEPRSYYYTDTITGQILELLKRELISIKNNTKEQRKR